MNGKLNKNIGFSLLPFAFIFLFEPGYTLVDVLPDFIGYTILCLALMNLSDINPRIQESCEGFRRALLINALRFISVYLLDRYFADVSKSLGLLIFCMIFSFFELIVLLPAYRNLFEGLLHIGMMHDSNAIYFKKVRKTKRFVKETNSHQVTIKESNRNITEKLYFFTIFFLLIRHTAMALPEFTTLINNSDYEFIKILRLFGALIAAPTGIVWLVRILTYFTKIRKEKDFISRLSEIYLKHVGENPQLYTARIITFGLYTALVGITFSLDFYSDSINIIPDYLFYGLILISAFVLKKHSKKWIGLSVLSISGIIVSVIQHSLTTSFYSLYYPNAIRKNLQAYYAYYKMLAFHIVEAVVFVITVAMIVLVLWDVFKKHTDIANTTSTKEFKEIAFKYKLSGILVIFCSLISSGGCVYYVIAQPFYYTNNWYFYYSAIISVFASIVFAFGASYFLGYVINSVKYKYRLYL